MTTPTVPDVSDGKERIGGADLLAMLKANGLDDAMRDLVSFMRFMALSNSEGVCTFALLFMAAGSVARVDDPDLKSYLIQTFNIAANAKVEPKEGA